MHQKVEEMPTMKMKKSYRCQKLSEEFREKRTSKIGLDFSPSIGANALMHGCKWRARWHPELNKSKTNSLFIYSNGSLLRQQECRYIMYHTFPTSMKVLILHLQNSNHGNTVL